MSPLLPNSSDPTVEDQDSTDQVNCAFEPKVAVVVGILAALLCMTFFLVLYGRHCKQAARRIRLSNARNPSGLVSGSGFHHQHFPVLRLAYDCNGGVLSQWIVDAVPKLQSSEKLFLGQIEVADCPVCLSKYDEGDLLRLLPRCRHVFHVVCVDKWLHSRPSCPVCRMFVSRQDVVDLDNFFLHGMKLLDSSGDEEQGKGDGCEGKVEVIVEPRDSMGDGSLFAFDDQMVLSGKRWSKDLGSGGGGGGGGGGLRKSASMNSLSVESRRIPNVQCSC